MLTDKKMFNLMFKELRSFGFKARQNVACCQTCAWAEMDSRYSITEEDNVVFYHNQDFESFDKHGNLISPIYLAWQGDGDKIKQVAESKGYLVDWDGTENKRIGILPR
jgi:hypothetical protein